MTEDEEIIYARMLSQYMVRGLLNGVKMQPYPTLNSHTIEMAFGMMFRTIRGAIANSIAEKEYDFFSGLRDVISFIEEMDDGDDNDDGDVNIDNVIQFKRK